MSIATPFGKDYLLIRKLVATEELSSLFKIDVELLHDESRQDRKAKTVSPETALGQAVTVSVTQSDEGARTFSGIITRMQQGRRSGRYSFFYATIMPRVWALTQSQQSRIFQQKTVPQILDKVFEGFKIQKALIGNFEPRNYCVQYRESDFDFAARLMEEEGIYYYFEHKDGVDTMIISNDPQAHKPCPNKSTIPYYEEKLGGDDWVSSMRDWQFQYQLQPGKVTNWDHNFELPTQKLDEQKLSRFNTGGNQQIEIYDYPGGYARKYDGIDKSGGEQPSELQKVFPDKKNTVKNRIEALDAHMSFSDGFSDCCSMTAGHKFTMANHPNKELNRDYILTSVQHEMEQNPDYPGIEENFGVCEATFTCIPHGEGAPVFRPLQKTPKPLVTGGQTATVVGSPGEEISTDKYGRVKVQFHWDREGKMDIGSSCWVRVAHAWAGNKWGMMFIPRIGMEVLVDFLEGDPDRPIITGCVYNPGNMPPYKLPDEKTKSTMKSNSTIGGGGFNEFRFEDKKGSEQIFVHGEKNMDTRIKNDSFETIGNDRHLIVESNQLENIKGDKNLIVKGDHKEKIDGAMSLKVGTSTQIKTGTKYAVDAGNEVHIKGGMKVIVEGGTQISLKAGGSFIDIGPAGVAIKGTMVQLNSGGMAGSGGGSSPDAPAEAKEADKAEAGKKSDPIPPPPPPSPKKYSPPAARMAQASTKGTAFVS